MLHVACCTVQVACSMFRVAWRMVQVARRMLHVARRIVHVARRMLHVACCTSHVACCMAKQRDDTTAAAITAPHRTAVAHGIRVCDENQGRAGRSGQGVALRSTRLARATRSSTTRSSTRSAKTCALPGAALSTRCSCATYALQPRVCARWLGLDGGTCAKRTVPTVHTE